ncbi:PREDICTED: uncharacterized protein LOC109242243 [Nicotiana attenuata]|uniref:uncharacterized protein LOC109242243 n=1 Tax=Nicotiana attenuata TaxID=49451 RepID=UPI0009053659|nr:PREDICTED: uncharacterized protein LOC109242243 [Nicotiana attenuata]
MASTLVNPLFADQCTTKQTRVSYARILIEVNVTKKLPTEITVKDPSGRHFQQPIEFEWKPEFCAECLKIGHDCVKEKQLGNQVQYQKNKRPRVVQKWIPKQQQKDPAVKARGSSSSIKAAAPQQTPVDIITANGFQGLTEEEQRNIKANPPDLGGNKPTQ